MKTTLSKSTVKNIKRGLAKISMLLISMAPLTAIAGGPAYGNDNNGTGTLNASSSANAKNTATTRQANAILSLRNDPLMQDFLPYNDTNKFSESEIAALQKIDHYLKGQADAEDNYRASKGCRRTVFLASLVGGPLVGVIPAAVNVAKTSDSTLNMPKTNMVNDDDYVNGYKHEAHYIKKHNTWGRYIIASLIWLAAANIILR
jgi:hypothetical protein